MLAITQYWYMIDMVTDFDRNRVVVFTCLERPSL